MPSDDDRPVGARRRLEALLVLLAVLALPLVAELATRVVLRARDGAWPESRAAAVHRERLVSTEMLFRPHPYLHVAPREGGRFQVGGDAISSVEEGAPPAVAISFNSHGYRSPERPLAKAPGVVRILCAGGSTTLDTLATVDSASWPWRLEEALRRRGVEAEVWNAGMAGWTSLESLISLAARDLDLEPDVVILMQGVNDLQPAAHEPFDPQYEDGHARLLRRALGFGAAPPAWHHRSMLLQVLRDARSGPPARAPLHDREVASDGLSERRSRIAPQAVATFERNLRSFAALSRAHGAEPLLLTSELRIRDAHRPQDEAYLGWWLPWLEPSAVEGELERLNDVVRRLGERGEARVVDVAAEVDWTDEEFGDPIHLVAPQRLVDSLVEPVLEAAQRSSQHRRSASGA